LKRNGYQLSGALTILEARKEASSFLADVGVNEPDSNAELLLRHVLGLEGAKYLLALRDPFPIESKEAWEALTVRPQVSQRSILSGSRNSTAWPSRSRRRC